MKKVTARQLQDMPIALYYRYYPHSEGRVQIKYGKEETWSIVDEAFPIDVPEIEGCGCWGDIQDKMEAKGLGEDMPISTLETSRDFLDGDETFIVYSKEDIRQLICKLDAVLDGMEEAT